MTDANGFRLLVVCPHFEPDTAPTGVVMTRIVAELVGLGHEVHVVTSLPWYREHRVEADWLDVTWSRRTTFTDWGSVTRVDPCAGSDKRNLLRRATGFVGFTMMCTLASFLLSRRRRIDAILVMSPPLTLGLGAKVVALLRRVPIILNVQDVFPDAAIKTGAISNRVIIAAARWMESLTYRASSVVTVLSNDLADNIRTKLPARLRDRVEVIPNFVDVAGIVPRDRSTSYRSELGLGDRRVVMYAGNIGFSQSLGLMVDAARAFPDVAFVINGTGSARADLEAAARGVDNVVFGEHQPAERLSDVLGTADLHVVLLRAGLGRVSVPSKTYSILAAGRPILASIDAHTEIPRLLEASGAGIAVAPDDPGAFIEGLRRLLSDPESLDEMGKRGRRFIEDSPSPRSVAQSYEKVIRRSIGRA